MGKESGCEKHSAKVFHCRTFTIIIINLSMHNYDPANKYKFQTRIGNWFEEWELEETK